MQHNENQSGLIHLKVPTELGEFVAGYSATGLARLNFPPRQKSEEVAEHTNASPAVRAWHRLTMQAVKAVLAGKDTAELPPLDLSAGTDFQRAVWNAMRKIRSGQTRSYGELAGDIGKPKAVRAVGGACGANPVPVIIPCHRVLAAGRKLGGFSGGLDWKRELLRREGVNLGAVVKGKH